MKNIRLEKDTENKIAFVWIDLVDEKFNTLKKDLVEDFKELTKIIETDDEIQGVGLLSGKDDNFIVGANIEELNQMESSDQAVALIKEAKDLLDKMEQSKKPIVAGINGPCLGGGLEVALACHKRIATNSSKTVFALPEVKLGLLPGAGGTQRLPKLIGVQASMDIMLTGKNVFAKKAKKLGIVEHVVNPGNIKSAVQKTLMNILNKKESKTQKPKIPFIEKIMPLRRYMYSVAKKTLDKQTKGFYPAPYKILECIKTGVESGVKVGTVKETKLFGELLVSDVSAELMNLFFAMTDAKKNPYLNDEEYSSKYDKVGVIGGGFMGAGIAEVTAFKEVPTIVKDISHETLSKGYKILWDSLTKKVKRKIISSFDRQKQISHYFPTLDDNDLRKCDIVIEAVFEELSLKQKILADYEALLPDTGIFASNTSAIPIEMIAEKAKRPENIIGMHYFSPVPKMPLLEIIKTSKTSKQTLSKCYELGLKQGKTIIVVNDGPGFYTTRMLMPMFNETVLLLESGAKIEDIDRAFKKFGFPIGPITLIDEVGIDVGEHIAKFLQSIFDKRDITTSDAITKLYNDGYHGRKNQKGFYKYGKKSKKKEINEDIYKYFGGGQRKTIDQQEIQDRLVYVMLNEAMYCLEENILEAPKDGDLGAIFGLGFPPFLGGPFRYMHKLGVKAVHEKILDLKSKHGKNFEPCKLFEKYVNEGKTFY